MQLIPIQISHYISGNIVLFLAGSNIYIVLYCNVPALDWLQTVWANYTKAVGFLEGKVGPSGLMNVTGLRDWARLGGGGINAEGNALLYQVCT